jgi:magnesium chelatase subunit I
MVTSERPRTVGDLRRAVAEGLPRHASVKDEVRANLLRTLRDRRPLFPGVIGYDETVVPHVVNALLSKHNFILLGLRGQAKTRLLRALVDLLDDAIPVVPGCEIHDDPLQPLCAACRARLAAEGDAMSIAWLGREDRYVEKLATPDVTIADMLGDIDPIKAARGGLQLGDELTMHYGLLPRANRGIFAINELPDLAGKIQVGLFNILQEGDVQIKGYPVRLRLDVLMAFTANPEDYTARGKIITPLKDRIGSEIRTHYAATRHHALAITRQEAWTTREDAAVHVPEYVREVVEEIAFQARGERRIDKRSGVSQRMPITVLENVTSNAERRALLHRESPAVASIADIYAALPAMTGKFELEYEGELRGADQIARDLIRGAVANVFIGYFENVDTRAVVDWFDKGGSLQFDETGSSASLLSDAGRVPGLLDLTRHAGVDARADVPARAAAVGFILEGLAATKRISRTDERGFQAAETGSSRRGRQQQAPDHDFDDMPSIPGSKKKYYN